MRGVSCEGGQESMVNYCYSTIGVISILGNLTRYGCIGRNIYALRSPGFVVSISPMQTKRRYSRIKIL